MKNFFFVLFFLKITTIFGQNQSEFYDFGVREVRIYFTEKNWEKRLDSIRKANPSGRILCSVSVDGRRFEECGVRYKGNSSYKKTKKQGFRKLPFNIKLDFRRADQALAGGETVLKLANVTGDPSFVREVLTYEIARNYMPAPRANFVRLYINDSFSGLYTNVESIDDAFLKKNYGYSKGVLIKCDPELDDKSPAEKGCPKLDATTRKADLTLFSNDTTCFSSIYELDSKFGWGKFRSFLQILNQSPEKIEPVLNVDQTLWMLALNNVLVNLDSYSGLICHNYYVFQDSFGRFQPLLWDLNLSFGGFRRIEPSAMSSAEMQQMPLFLHENNPKRPLISQLLKNPRYKKLYVAHVRTILDDWFLNEKYLARAREMQSAISSWVKNDTIKLYDFAGFEANLTKTVTSIVGKDQEEVIGLEELMKPRTDFLKNQPALKAVAPLISQVLWAEKDSFVQISARIENIGRVAAIYFKNKNSTVFEKINFNDDGLNGDATPNDHLFFAKIESSKIGEFYILAENLEAISMFPAQAPRTLVPRSSAP
jgi:CotH kinase protein